MLERTVDPTIITKAGEYILGKARKARRDLPTFHEFVQRDEATQRRIVTQPFQYLVLDFIERMPKCVLMMPPGSSKTNLLVSRTLHRIGEDPTRRCLYMSKDQPKGVKFVTTIKTYIEESSELRLVFPTLLPTNRQQEHWTNESLVVDRPLGIKDPTLTCASDKTGIAGMRLSDIVVDDVLDQMNTRTQVLRDKTWRQHEDVLLHRLDQGSASADTRMVVMNTAWDQDDYLHRLMDPDSQKFGVGWPALLIDIYGNVWIKNVPTDLWDPPQLRPAKSNVDAFGRVIDSSGPFRIRVADDAYAKATGDDPDHAPLWYPKFTHEAIKKLQDNMTAVAFNQAYRLVCRSEETARCKMSWIDACLDNGRKGIRDKGIDPHHRMVVCSAQTPYQTPNPVVMGVDLAFGVGEDNDSNCISIWEFLPTGEAKLLWILTLQTNSPEMLELIYERSQAFGDCHVIVESVGAQKMMVDFLRKRDASIKCRPFNTTGAGATNKWDRVTGVESTFIMVKNAAWILPCAPNERPHKEVEKLINACIYYLPTAHTPDELMATWFAMWFGRRLHAYLQMEKGTGAGGLLSLNAR